MITVIDIKIGNIGSVTRALQKIKAPYQVTSDPEVIKTAKKIILTGVGNFREASERIKSSGIDKAIKEKVLKEGTPILGICLGMQLMASTGSEGGVSDGLNLFKGEVKYHRCSSLKLPLPHVGWNKVDNGNLPILKTIPDGSHFYFVHSYELLVEKDVPAATCHYGVDFVAAIQKEHIIGTQFHPEKSQNVGLALLQNFAEGNY